MICSNIIDALTLATGHTGLSGSWAGEQATRILHIARQSVCTAMPTDDYTGLISLNFVLYLYYLKWYSDH